MTGTSSRMLALLSLLQSRRDWSGPALAERLSVSARTVRRDVDRLRDLGYTIDATRGPDGGYRLAAGEQLPPLLFDDEQATAIAIALRRMPSSGVDLDDAAARALATVRQVMPSRLRHRTDSIRFTEAPSPPRVDAATLETVSAAVREQRTLRFDYGGSDQHPPRRAEPHAVVARGGRWYLVAWDLERDAWRIFRLDRLTPRGGGAPFRRRALPAGGAAAFVAARFKGSDTADEWPCRGELVVERPAAEVAPWIDDGEVEARTERSCRVVLGSWSWAGVLAAALRFDAPFTVVGPEPLRDAAAALATRLARAGSASPSAAGSPAP